MFVNSDYLNYDNVVDISDNYVILTNSRSVNGEWQHPDTINIIYQYLKPSFLTIEDKMTFTTSKTFEPIDVSDNFWERADALNIIVVQFFIIFFILFIFNSLTRFVRKGGVIFGS